MRTLAFVLISLITLCSCSPLSKSSLKKKFRAIEGSLHDHTGFVLYDTEKKKTVFEYNSAKYFTPASNTKIFTLFASLKILGDSIPALHYTRRNDSLLVWGTGDPSFLYKYVYQNNRTYDFLARDRSPLYLSTTNFHTSALGPGWAWDDYNDYYSAERSPLPVYGNIFSVTLAGDSPKIDPPFFRKFYTRGEQKDRNRFMRKIHANEFTFHPGLRRSSTTEWDIPMRVDQQLIVDLLQDTLKRPVIAVSEPKRDSVFSVQTLYSIPADSLYRVLMQDSDNFIAEQLLLLCSDVLRDTLQPEITIRYVKENFLSDLSDEPRWVDGSGLSRFNLFTPRSIIQVWQKIAEIVPPQRLYPLLATGGLKGTIRNWYKAEKPYIFGKTGSLSNNHCLSGFLVTRSGKTLLFSFMNSNYVVSANEVRRNMQEVLNTIYEKY